LAITAVLRFCPSQHGAIAGADAMSFANQFYALAGNVRPAGWELVRSLAISSFDQNRDRTALREARDAMPRKASHPGWIPR
jgi:hypothetical protein